MPWSDWQEHGNHRYSSRYAGEGRRTVPGHPFLRYPSLQPTRSGRILPRRHQGCHWLRQPVVTSGNLFLFYPRFSKFVPPRYSSKAIVLPLPSCHLPLPPHFVPMQGNEDSEPVLLVFPLLYSGLLYRLEENWSLVVLSSLFLPMSAQRG